MLKICDSNIFKPLSLIFENFVKIAIFCEKSNTVLIGKNNDEQIINKDRLV